MILFEALYGIKCNTPENWDNPMDREMVGPKLLREMDEKMVRIKQNLKVPWDIKKSYVDKGRTHRDFKLGDHVFLKLKAKRIS
jgi:hypothetical protein